MRGGARAAPGRDASSGGTLRAVGPELRFGRGVVGALEQLAPPVLLVTGRATLQRTGLERLADRDGVFVHHGVRPNPSPEVVDAVVARARRVRPETIVGLGGGSAIDVAKAAAVALGHETDVRGAARRLELGRQAARPVGLVAVPTTAGTGSEATSSCSLWEGGRKWSLESVHGRPDLALVDPGLTDTMGPRLTAATGLDAVGHAAEALLSVRVTTEAEARAILALRLAREHLIPAVRAARDGVPCPAHRDGMARAALAAGQAQGTARTAAAHALSYGLTGAHGLEHGLAVGLGLRALLPLHAVRSPRRCALVLGGLDVPDVAAADAFLCSVFRAAGTEPRLGHFGIPPRAWAEVVAQAAESARLANDASRPTATDLLDLMETIT